MSNAEELADEYERGEADINKIGKASSKRSKAEQHEHKHAHPEGETRKIVNYCISGQEKRKTSTDSTGKKSKE
ncbi:unnamed protein product [Thelazia callipaeda]|uniref:Nuclear protein 1 n=1 Tax=Thelazia callipaeda TaxID=103827 RepID=A0A0N5D807_THECL|nr:unnamed protein product [Thelazia callipaeda]